MGLGLTWKEKEERDKEYERQLQDEKRLCVPPAIDNLQFKSAEMIIYKDQVRLQRKLTRTLQECLISEVIACHKTMKEDAKELKDFKERINKAFEIFSRI